MAASLERICHQHGRYCEKSEQCQLIQKGALKVNKVAALGLSCLLFSCPTVFGQDAMKYGLKHLTVLAEDQKVRVLRYAPSRGDKTPMHSHPTSVVYVLKGGRVKYTMPDGSIRIAELKSGEALIRPPVTHSDEALDNVETILVEIKQ
jgi:quercetin dioxygenase-like cupin family protein